MLRTLGGSVLLALVMVFVSRKPVNVQRKVEQGQIPGSSGRETSSGEI